MAGPDGEPGLPQAYLLGFDTKGLGHAIIANGSPDTADNTAVYVPRTESQLAKAAGDDPVPYIGRPFLGGHKWGVQYYDGVPYSAGYIQTIPSDEAFGAHRMHVNTSGHSGYWDEGSVSLENQGAVVVGKYGDVKEDN
ncbi:hypothetical protein ACLMNJ_24705 [Streptomyces seoulensis]